MRYIIFILASLLLFSTYSISQYNKKNYELGVEILAAGGSNLGGNIGGAVKFAFVENEEIAYGPLLRYQYFWSNNVETGVQGNRSFLGLGGFLHYRFMDWFYLGTEIEVNQNPFRTMKPENTWSLAGFLGGGVHRDFDFVHLNAGLLFDAVDALRNPLTDNPSAFRTSYFLKRSNPSNPSAGLYVPVIYRISFFFPLGR